MAKSKVISAIYENLKASKEEHDGAAVIASKDVAKILKIKLAEAFPGVKFSVKSDYSAVDVYWENGPHPLFVDAIIDKYSFGGFDGSIDLAYSNKNWLLPNGDMVPASSEGTQGSMGYVPSFATDCPQPGAVLVKFGPKYVSSHHSYSDEVYDSLVAKYCQENGIELPEGVKPWDYHVAAFGERLSTLVYRWLRDAAKELQSAKQVALS